jgi:hypothetical protein
MHVLSPSSSLLLRTVCLLIYPLNPSPPHPHYNCLSPQDVGKRRQLLRKEEEEGLLQAFQTYLYLQDSKVYLAKKIRREPTELELTRYTKTDIRY